MGPDAEDVAMNFHVVDHEPAFLCQDCRNVLAQMQGRDDTLHEESVTMADLQGAITAVAHHRQHEVDFDYLIERAQENLGLRDAIARYRELESSALWYLEQSRYYTRRYRCSSGDARDRLVKEHADAVQGSNEDAAELVDWYLARGRRFDDLKRLEFGRDPVAAAVSDEVE